jgi:chromosome segregation ATPase
MKRIFTATILLAGLFASGQRKIEVFITEKDMSQGKQTAFVVLVPEAKIDLVEKEWKKYANDRSMIESITKGVPGRFIENTYKTIANTISTEKELEKNNQKLRVVKENDEFVIRNIVHQHLTQHLLDIYARITQLDSSTQVSAFYRYSDSIFINESNVDEEAIISLKNYMYQFGIEAYKSEVQNQIDTEEKVLNRMKTTLNNMESKNESLEKAITRAESEIENCESEIEMNYERLPEANNMVANVKKQMLGRSKDSPEFAELKLQLKEREKEKKEIMNDTQRLKTKIKQQEFRIKKANSEILTSQREQETQSSKIEAQKSVISGLEEKLLNIR